MRDAIPEAITENDIKIFVRLNPTDGKKLERFLKIILAWEPLQNLLNMPIFVLMKIVD